MRIKAIEFDDEGGFSAAVVRMTADEAAFVAKVLGHQTGVDSERVMPGGGTVSHEIFDALVGQVFNALFDDGVDEYLRGRA